MNDKFLRAIRQYDMISDGDSVCVAVSGGADSMCLLELFLENREKLGISVSAAHVNHCIRGEESDRDENYVKNFCEKNGVFLHSVRIDIPQLSEKEGISTELCARNKRYEFFDSLPFTKIATAHTGSDCIETMLMNLSRGTSLHGLCSIPPVRGKFIRPLVFFTREDTENYCNDRNIRFVTDSTNLSDEYTRNKYRHYVLALLKKINVSFEQNALRCISSLREDDDYLSEASKILFSDAFDEENQTLSSVMLRNAHPAVAKRVIADYFGKILGSDYEFRHITTLFDGLDKKTAVTLPSGITVINDSGVIKKHGTAANNKRIFESVSFLPEEGFFGSFGSFNINAYTADIAKNVGLSEIALDLSEIKGKITIRGRQSGDKMSLAGRRCTKTLKKLFTEKKIPPEKRDTIPVFADNEGVLFVPMLGINSRCAKNDNTKKYLIIKTECDKK